MKPSARKAILTRDRVMAEDLRRRQAEEEEQKARHPDWQQRPQKAARRAEL